MRVRVTLAIAAGAAVLLATTACSRRKPSHAPIPAADRSSGALPELRVTRVDAGAVNVDGRLTEPVWQGEANATGGLVHPATGKPNGKSQVQGGAWFAWDDQHLYFAARIDDPSPTAPFAPTDEDPHLWERSSGVELMLQPGDAGDNRDYYELQLDSATAHWDTRFDDYNRPITADPATGAKRFGHQDWAPALRRGATVHREEGWYELELAIPWTDLRPSARTAIPPRPGDVWRANVYSFRDGQRDSLAWSPTLKQGNFHFAPRFGKIVFE